jgi:hypothetical protein
VGRGKGEMTPVNRGLFLKDNKKYGSVILGVKKRLHPGKMLETIR